MGERRVSREDRARTDREILAHEDDVHFLAEVKRGRVVALPALRMILRCRFAREDLISAGLGTASPLRYCLADAALAFTTRDAKVISQGRSPTSMPIRMRPRLYNVPLKLEKAAAFVGPRFSLEQLLMLMSGRSATTRVRLAPVGSEAEQELDDRWWLGLRGSVLESVNPHEFMVVLEFEGGSALTVESPASVRAASAPSNETTAVIRSEDGKISASAALTSLIGLQVRSSGFKTGKLRLVFESGQMLVVAHNPHYEAWQLTGPSGRTWVSLPGGGLATFPRRPS